MSSLLQSPGRIDRRGVEIFLIRCTAHDPRYNNEDGTPSTIGATEETETLPDLARPRQPVLYRIWRKPAGMFGCWVLFRLNGRESPLDLSVPTRVFKLPHDAQRLTPEEATRYWKS